MSRLSIRRQLNGSTPGMVHISNHGSTDFETLCGFCWSGNGYEDDLPATEPVTCHSCYEVWRSCVATKRVRFEKPQS